MRTIDDGRQYLRLVRSRWRGGCVAQLIQLLLCLLLLCLLLLLLLLSDHRLVLHDRIVLRLSDRRNGSMSSNVVVVVVATDFVHLVTLHLLQRDGVGNREQDERGEQQEEVGLDEVDGQTEDDEIDEQVEDQDAQMMAEDGHDRDHLVEDGGDVERQRGEQKLRRRTVDGDVGGGGGVARVVHRLAQPQHRVEIEDGEQEERRIDAVQHHRGDDADHQDEHQDEVHHQQRVA